MGRLRKALTHLAASAKQQWHWMTTDDGPWNYAGCCGCGRQRVDFTLIDRDRRGRPLAGETYCAGCFLRDPMPGFAALATNEHVRHPQPLIAVPWRDAGRQALELADAAAER